MSTFASLRRRLFGSLGNSLVTITMLVVFALALPPMLRWLVIDATWSTTTPAECREAGGACWAVLHEKYRLILFGRYPYEEQWRPLLATAMLLAIVLATCSGQFTLRWLATLWIVGISGAAILMAGGLFGLARVETTHWGGLPLTVILSLMGIALAFPLAILLALGRRSSIPLIHSLCAGCIELIRGVPLVSMLFMASFLIPLLLPGGVQINELLRAQAAIVLVSAAYLAEAIRGGLQAVPSGQEMAAKSLGLGYWQTMGLIVLPQALRVAIPSIVNVFIGLFKDTSLVGIVGLTDLLLSAKQALADPAWRTYTLEAYLFIAAIYFCFCFFMSSYSKRLERKGHVQHA